MNDESTFKGVAGISAIIAALLALFSTFVFISAVGFEFELLDEPADIVTLGPEIAEQFRWGWILAGFGFYLLLVAAVLYVDTWLKTQRADLVRMYTVFGLGYCFIGGLSLFTMAAVLPPMMSAYAETVASERDLLVVVFQASADLASFSFGTLSFILGGVWWFGIGLELRASHNLLGIVTVVLGVATFGSGLGYLFQVETLARLEVFNFFLGPVWAAWIGVVILRGKETIGQAAKEAAAV